MNWLSPIDQTVLGLFESLHPTCFFLRKMASNNSASTSSTKSCSRFSSSWRWRQNRWHHQQEVASSVGSDLNSAVNVCVCAGRVRPGGDQVDPHRLLQQQGGLWPHWVQTGELTNRWRDLKSLFHLSWSGTSLKRPLTENLQTRCFYFFKFQMSEDSQSSRSHHQLLVESQKPKIRSEEEC